MSNSNAHTSGKGKQNTSNTYSTRITLPHLYRLPAEIMSIIFHYIYDSQTTLYQCTLVSKMFYYIANPLLWEYPIIYDRLFLHCMLRMSFQRRNALGQLVRSLFIDQTNVPGITFIIIARYCRQLEFFEWYLSSSHQSSSFFRHLSPCPLRHFRGSFNYTAPDRTTIATIKSFDQLTCLDLSLIWQPIWRTLLADYSFPHLTTLRLFWCSHINDEILIAFIKSHTMLEQLKLDNVRSFTNDTLDAICGLPRFTKLDINYNYRICSAAVQRLIKACPLTYLRVVNCEQVMTFDLPESDCPNLFLEKMDELDDWT